MSMKERRDLLFDILMRQNMDDIVIPATESPCGHEHLVLEGGRKGLRGMIVGNLIYEGYYQCVGARGQSYGKGYATVWVYTKVKN